MIGFRLALQIIAMFNGFEVGVGVKIKDIIIAMIGMIAVIATIA